MCARARAPTVRSAGLAATISFFHFPNTIQTAPENRSKRRRFLYPRVINPRYFSEGRSWGVEKRGLIQTRDPHERRIDGCNPELAENGYNGNTSGLALSRLTDKERGGVASIGNGLPPTVVSVALRTRRNLTYSLRLFSHLLARSRASRRLLAGIRRAIWKEDGHGPILIIYTSPIRQIERSKKREDSWRRSNPQAAPVHPPSHFRSFFQRVRRTVLEYTSTAALAM